MKHLLIGLVLGFAVQRVAKNRTESNSVPMFEILDVDFLASKVHYKYIGTEKFYTADSGSAEINSGSYTLKINTVTNYQTKQKGAEFNLYKEGKFFKNLATIQL